MTANMPVILSLFSGTDIENHLDGLSKLLHDCVHAGASIGFILPHSRKESEAFWLRKVLPAVNDDSRLLLVAKRGKAITGSVQLDYDTPATSRIAPRSANCWCIPIAAARALPAG